MVALAPSILTVAALQYTLDSSNLPGRVCMTQTGENGIDLQRENVCISYDSFHVHAKLRLCVRAFDMIGLVLIKIWMDSRVPQGNAPAYPHNLKKR
jgi:hypothetical protein